MPRFYCPGALAAGALIDLPTGAARHVQVLRLQPGDPITLFDGDTPGEFSATVMRMGRSSVQVQVGDFVPTWREPNVRVHLALGMPANERMDWLVEKAAELGAASVQPLMTERSVLRLSGERAGKKVTHWQSVAVAACEQCGGNRVPLIHPVLTLAQWLQQRAGRSADAPRSLLLSLRQDAPGLREAASGSAEITLLSGPEGGFSPAEEAAALAAGLAPVTLGPRVLRAETAALAALAALTALLV